MAIDINDIVKQATGGSQPTGASSVQVISSESAKTKSGSGLV
jgi:hypothetical protein